MALLKNFKYPNGTETNYHKIGEIRIAPKPDQVETILVSEAVYPEEGGEMGAMLGPIVPAIYETVTKKYVQIMVQILSYVSQEIREDALDNVVTKQLQYFAISMDELIANDIMTICYDYLKTLAVFEDAEDV